MHAPTRIRWPTQLEWQEAEGVFGNTLPDRRRVLLTNGLGMNDRAFCIPTSALSVLSIPGFASTGIAGLLSEAPGPLGLFSYTTRLGATSSMVASVINLGYLVNIGPGPYPDMLRNGDTKGLLIHELTHVWQGHNSIFSMEYVYNSFYNQCRSEITGASSYRYTIETPPQPFSAFNAEQQASIVEHWYASGENESESADPRWIYIRDNIRRGRA